MQHSTPPGITVRGLYAADDWGSGDEQWPAPPPSPKESEPFSQWITKAIMNSDSLQNASQSVQGIVSSMVVALVVVGIGTHY